MTQTSELAPVTGAERIQALDAIRGFALLGILLMNIEGMVGPLMASMTGLNPALSGADRWVDGAIYLLVQGKFFPLFSMLFGMGFAIMLARAQAAGRPFFGVYLRRVLALLVIGLLHALLVWSGDILVTYALMGLLLLLFFRNTPQSRLPKWGIALILLPAVFTLGLGLLGTALQSLPEEASAEFNRALAEQSQQMAALVQAQREAYGSGGFAEATAQRLDDFLSMMGFLVIYGAFILGLFLVGAWFARSGAIARPAEHARLFTRLRWVALPVGLAMVLVSFWLEPTMDFGRLDLRASTAQVLQMLGGAVMAVSYLAWVVHGLHSAAAGRLLGLLGPAGRMALTNYLLQSLVATFIFFGYGLGYFEQLPRAWQPVYVFGFFALQVALSHWWMARFRFGPAEWAWRAATYLSLPPMRRG
ncbi:DUF418 domain-containing protein [Arenimonas donghaensis]|uniref:DUF418 domain-containing protein n=1 Tax=Arenimonas donghaensis DSM 18148 = HO3-R19 TaxID=1121014 RepID=A0A087MIZ8_9GAMM|nr:DUF418 domain-containing protein [Arenimonas donghaensis]KFL36851.1 hypothetical protein N788_04335 [Arenimonas donghaensis DSM 18148 = HO3-R19]